MDLGSFIYWLLVSMGVCFLIAAVLAIRHISKYSSSIRFYSEMADKHRSDLSGNSKRASGVSMERSDIGRQTIHFKKESISSGEKYVFEEML